MSNNQVRMNKSEYVNSIYADAVSKLKNITAGELHVSPLKMVDMLEGSEVKTLPAIQMGNKIHENGIHKGYMIVTYNGQSLLNVINGHNKIEGIKKTMVSRDGTCSISEIDNNSENGKVMTTGEGIKNSYTDEWNRILLGETIL